MATAKLLPKNANPRARKPYTVRYWDDKGQHERSFRTSGERKAFAVKFENDSREGTFVDPRAGRVPFAEYAAQWIDGLDRAEGTRANYRWLLSKYVGPAFDGRALAQAAQDREALTGMLTRMREAGLSGSRRSLAKALVTGALTEAKAAKRIPGHCMDDIHVSQSVAKPATVTPITDAQYTRLAAGLPAPWALTVDLMRGLGLRISEALAVKADGFRDDGRVLRITEQTAKGGAAGPLKARRAGEYRDIPCPGWVWAKVQAHVREHGTDDGYLFSRPGGGRVGYDRYIRRFHTAARRALLPDLTPHGLRHLYASRLLSAGVPLTDVSKFLGHRDVNITAQVYAHLMPSSWDRARDALESLAG
jgi:integrase